MGPSSAVLWLLAMLVFFIPCSLAVMELSSRLPGEGGLYLWSKSAFGEFHGFIAGWAYWVNNVFYFPSLLMFLAGAFLFIGGERWLSLSDSGWYNLVFALLLIWAVIGINIIGVERAKWVASTGAFASIAVFVVLAITGTWAWIAHGSATTFESASLVPDVSDFTTLTFFATMTFAFAGMELAPAMAGEIKDPRQTIPRYGTPHVALITQGVVVSLIILLLDLSIILYFIPFLYMFAALPILRRRAGGDEEGVRLVPLGNAGPWLFGGLGFAATMLSVVLAFIPPAGTSNPGLLVVKTTASTLLFVAVGLGYYWRGRKAGITPAP
jgi:amino acid transporter